MLHGFYRPRRRKSTQFRRICLFTLDSIQENIYVLLRLRVQNRRKKWNFRTMRKLSELYSGIFQNY